MADIEVVCSANSRTLTMAANTETEGNSVTKNSLQATVESVPDSPTAPEVDEKPLEEEDISLRVVLCPARRIAVFGLPIISSTTLNFLPDQPRDRLLHATARIGFPLYYHVVDDPDYFMTLEELETLEEHRAAGAVLDTLHNKILYAFSLRTSSKYPGYKGATTPDEVSPTVMLARADGEDLGEVQVELREVLGGVDHSA